MAFETINLGTQPAGTGGDTARSAFEKTNRNFLAAEVLSAAMSQVQFEAIRLQNKERYAASGWVNFGNHEAGKQVNECKPGLYTALTTPNTLLIGKAGGVGGSKTDNAALNMAGVLFHLPVGFGIKFPQAPDGKTTYNKSTGVITTHATVTAAFNAQAADPTNVEVVTDRVDMWGFEAWLEEVNTTNPYIYPNGLTQSQATTMDGIATSASARPSTYYAVFDGDTTSKGKGLNFFALTDAQKKKVLTNPKNNLYYLDDGRLVQWRLRQRTIAGAGNGDFFSINANSSGYLSSATQNQIVPQGSINTVTPFTSGAALYTGYLNTEVIVRSKEIGLFGVRYILWNGINYPDDICINNECYFLVCGTFNKLNQGIYHPSYNPFGAAKAVGNAFWHNTAASVTSKADCFDSAKLLTGSGAIASGNSGRPDSRYYNASYAEGQGGVCRDMRYSVSDSVDFSESVKRFYNDMYRGFELFRHTKVFSSSSAATTAGYTVQDNSNPAAVVAYKSIAVSIGGKFLQIDVLGTPANIIATPQLANGWIGGWITTIPDGTNKSFEYVRDKVAEAVSKGYAYWTSNNGFSWQYGLLTSSGIDVNNTFMSNNSFPATYVTVVPYIAFAKQTEGVVNGTIAGSIPINVFASSDYLPENCSLLGESLIGKVLKNNAGVSVNNKSLLSCAIDGTGKLTSASNFDGITHPALTLGAPTNNSPAFKAVSYLANINQQAFIQYAYTELKHNGTSWGDDGKVTIVDNQATKTDLNGNTVLVGTARLKEPIGWIKNKV